MAVYGWSKYHVILHNSFTLKYNIIYIVDATAIIVAEYSVYSIKRKLCAISANRCWQVGYTIYYLMYDLFRLFRRQRA